MTELQQKIDLLTPLLSEARAERFNSVLVHRTEELTVVLDGTANEHNISAVIRSADAFGLSRVYVIGDGFSPSSGVAMGTERWLEIRHL